MLLTDYNNVSDWFYIIVAALLVDFIVIVLAKYPGQDPVFKVKSLNEWYDRFGAFAVISDVTSLLIGIAVTRYIYTNLNLENPLYFFIILGLFQLAHDLFFFIAIITPITKGENQMIDVFKSYAKENGAKILLADAAMLFSTVIISDLLNSLPDHYTVTTGIITLYALSYIVFTKS